MAKVKENFDEASTQAWPSFVDIMSSTIVVLLFALLIVVIVLSVSTVSSSVGTQRDESSPSEVFSQSDVLGEFRAEFQKVLIIANPSLRRRMEIETQDPAYIEPDSSVYSPVESEVDKPKPVEEPGESTKQILGDIPKEIDSKSSEVLKELLIVQRDVIEQQRKVIEQQSKEIEETTREYQSLLSLVTKEQEVEDIRQDITPKENQANFIDTLQTQSRVGGPQEDPNGATRYALNDSSQLATPVMVVPSEDNIIVKFTDNSPFLLEESYELLKEQLQQRISSLNDGSEVMLEAKMSDFAVSQAESQKVAVDRLLVIRSLLLDLGVSAKNIKLKTLDKKDDEQEEDYGFVSIK